MNQVFISHAMKEDRALAHRLDDDFRQKGVNVWIAPDSILPSDTWGQAIEHGLAPEATA